MRGEITGNVETHAWKKEVALQSREQILIYACLNVPMVCILLVRLSWHSSNGNHELAHQKVSTVIIDRLSLFTYVALPCFTVASLDRRLFLYNIKRVGTIPLWRVETYKMERAHEEMPLHNSLYDYQAAGCSRGVYISAVLYYKSCYSTYYKFCTNQPLRPVKAPHQVAGLTVSAGSLNLSSMRSEG